MQFIGVLKTELGLNSCAIRKQLSENKTITEDVRNLINQTREWNECHSDYCKTEAYDRVLQAYINSNQYQVSFRH
ncbi:hypothetical protein GZ78_08305 [Endozoicomonas numazuensis]|uniref:Uncharacterized protein n=1 Tax=Endozoicomonas numazuensis TaxID=1137799 RepID=A0A081NGW4_9GAMM|nr:hypothetical protein GZ78_08305 [Endozoicomonas numazuensis]